MRPPDTLTGMETLQDLIEVVVKAGQDIAEADRARYLHLERRCSDDCCTAVWRLNPPPFANRYPGKNPWAYRSDDLTKQLLEAKFQFEAALLVYEQWENGADSMPIARERAAASIRKVIDERTDYLQTVAHAEQGSDPLLGEDWYVERQTTMLDFILDSPYWQNS